MDNPTGLIRRLLPCLEQWLERERFGEAGRQRIASHFGVERMASAYRRVLFEGA